MTAAAGAEWLKQRAFPSLAGAVAQRRIVLARLPARGVWRISLPVVARVARSPLAKLRSHLRRGFSARWAGRKLARRARLLRTPG